MANEMTTRAERDRALFDRIATKYSVKDLLPAHRLARKLRLQQTLSVIGFNKHAAVLELGCGAGFGAAYLDGRFSCYHGVDYSSELISYANKYNSRANITFECADIHEWQSTSKFDLIIMIGFLHHLTQPAATLSRALQFLKPGGWVVANEPQKGNPLVSAARNFRKKLDDHYSEEQVEMSASEARRLFLDAGLTEITMKSQGIFSTPFAEIALPLQSIILPVSRAACSIDRFLEGHFVKGISRLAWNLIAAGKLPSGVPKEPAD